MAVFNPPIGPTNDPTYGKESKPIHQFEGDKSFGIGLKGFGDVFGQGIKVAAALDEEDIKRRLVADVEAEKEVETTAREEVGEGLQGRPPSLIMDAKKDTMPTDLMSLGNHVQNLQKGKDAGSFSGTYYKMRITELAKHYRALYPGRADFIDQTISSAAGFPVANAYMESLLTDINAMANKKDDTDKVINQVYKESIKTVPGVVDWKRDVDAGKMHPDEFLKRVNDYHAVDVQMARQAHERSARTGDADESKRNAIKDSNLLFARAASNIFQGIEDKAGLIDPKMGTPQQFSKMIDDAMTGKIKISGEDAVTMRQNYDALANRVEGHLWDQMNRPDKNGETLVSRIGSPEEAKKILDGHMFKFRMVGEALHKGNIPLAISAKTSIDARTQDFGYNLLANKALGPDLLMYKYLSELNPTLGASYLSRLFGSGLPARTQEYLKGEGLQFMLQPNWNEKGLPPEYREQGWKPTGQPHTFLDSVNQAQRDGITSKVYYKELNKFFDIIRDPNAKKDQKEGLMIAMFHPNNDGYVSKFPMGGKDQAGRPITGKFEVFNNILSEANWKEVQKVGAEKPEIKQMAINWAERTFATDLFDKEVLDLKAFMASSNFKVDYVMNEKTGLRRWEVTEPTKGPLAQRGGDPMTGPGPSGRAYLEQAKASVERLNAGLSRMSMIAKAENKDVDTYLFNLLINAGVDPSKSRNPTSIPEHMLNSITNLRIKQKLKEKQGSE